MGHSAPFTPSWGIRPCSHPRGAAPFTPSRGIRPRSHPRGAFGPVHTLAGHSTLFTPSRGIRPCSHPRGAFDPVHTLVGHSALFTPLRASSCVSPSVNASPPPPFLRAPSAIPARSLRHSCAPPPSFLRAPSVIPAQAGTHPAPNHRTSSPQFTFLPLPNSLFSPQPQFIPPPFQGGG